MQELPIPPPARQLGSVMSKLAALEPGGTLYLPKMKIKRAAMQCWRANKRFPDRRYRSRSEDGGVRIYRTL